MEPQVKPTRHSQTYLNCTYNAAGLIFIVLGTIFIFQGCTRFYKAIGLTEKQAATQTAKDQASRQQLSDQFRLTTTEIISSAMAGAGAILSGLLARWLGTERKITTALITGIETANNQKVKKSVNSKATAAGVEPLLHRRVVKLT